MIKLSCRPRPDKSTEILIGTGLDEALREFVAAMGEGRSVVALADSALGERSRKTLPAEWRRIELPGGEAVKTFPTLERVLRQMAEWQLDRRCILIAIGGGTIGDLGGLVASLFLRGIDLIQVPTTLLAMLDSSVGGKTAINIEEGKNLVGTFWPPLLTLADMDHLATLPTDQLLSGLGEAIKMAIGFDESLFELLEREREAVLAGDAEVLTKVVGKAIEAKIATVEADPMETTGRRRCLNLGHTLAHAIESLSGYTALHGHAVAQGLHYAIDIAIRRGTMPTADAKRCHALLESYGFSPQELPSAAQLQTFFARDKKMEDGILHAVLPTGIGSCRTVPMPPADFSQ